MPWLVPLRHGRMGVSPFTFYRGTARIMAADLATTPSSGLWCSSVATRTCPTSGPMHHRSASWSFDANDFDETLPGPFEWDLKRLATSFTIAAATSGLRRRRLAEQITARSVEAYRTSMTPLRRAWATSTAGTTT